MIPNREAPNAPIWKRYTAIVLILVAIAALLSFEFGRTLAFGWGGFIERVMPGVSPRPQSVAAALTAMVILTVAVHWLVGRWVAWSWRQSVAVTLLLFMLFAASVALVAVGHNAIWYATDPEPMLGASFLTRVNGRAESSNQMCVFSYAFYHHHDHRGRLPAGATFNPDGRPLHGWEVDLLPMLEQDSLWQRIDRTRPWDDPMNMPHFQGPLDLFLNPALALAPRIDVRGVGLNHYAANSHLFSADKPMRLSDLADGYSQTFFLGETNNRFPAWGRPMNVRDPTAGLNFSPFGFGGPPSSGGVQFLFGDARVLFLSEKISPAVLRALASPNGGDKLSPDEFNRLRLDD